MFNNYSTTIEEHRYPKEIKTAITEKKAPTDESLHLLREMQREIRDSLVSINLENNKVNFRWEIYDDLRCFQLSVLWEIIINGDKYRDTIFFDCYAELPKPIEFKKKVIDAISKTIAERCFDENMGSVVTLYQRQEDKRKEKQS